MEYVWLILAIVGSVAGVIGAVLPVLPGQLISYASLWMMWLYDKGCVSATNLWVMGILMVVVTVLDYIAPAWMTKLGGGSKRSMYGATIGTIAGLFFVPWGIIFGPFLGALIGELTTNAPFTKALKVASLSFLAFILTTGLKILYSIGIITTIVMALWEQF
jgi:uncharacterized protein YqgC (DUF456 family)